MRYAILSDLHANIEALDAVLASIDRERIDSLICLGDIVGYNASPNECVDRVRALEMRSIAGNHDRAAIGTKDPSQFGRAARHAIKWTKTVLTDDSAAFLRSLPMTMRVDERFFLVHGALHPEPNDDLHLSNDLRVEKSFLALTSGRFGASVCFFGHTHHAIGYEHRGSAIRRVAPSRLAIDPRFHYLINPGSVGQPRDGDERAAYAIFDAADGSVEWRRVAYDVASAERRKRRAGLVEEPLVRRSLSRLRAVFSG